MEFGIVARVMFRLADCSYGAISLAELEWTPHIHSRMSSVFCLNTAALDDTGILLIVESWFECGERGGETYIGAGAGRGREKSSLQELTVVSPGTLLSPYSLSWLRGPIAHAYCNGFALELSARQRLTYSFIVHACDRFRLCTIR